MEDVAVPRKSFSEQLRRIVAREGDTKYEIAKRLGVPYMRIDRLLRGGGISMETIDHLFKVLDLELVKRGKKRP